MIYIIKIDKVRNTDLVYEKTKTKEWTKILKRRKLNWTGHLLRMNKETPARQPLLEYKRKNEKGLRKTMNSMDKQCKKGSKDSKPKRSRNLSL